MYYRLYCIMHNTNADHTDCVKLNLKIKSIYYILYKFNKTILSRKLQNGNI